MSRDTYSIFQASLHGVCADAALPTVLERVASLCAPAEEDDVSLHKWNYVPWMDKVTKSAAFTRIEFTFVPQVETPPGPERNNDAVLRLCSVLQHTVFGHESNQWSILQVSSPEAQTADSATTLQAVMEVMLDTDFASALSFLGALGYRPHHQYALAGYQFQYKQSTRVQIYKVYPLSSPSVDGEFDAAGASPLPGNKSTYIVKVFSQPRRGSDDSQRSTTADLQQDLLQFGRNMQGLVSLSVVDTTLLRQVRLYT
ncbi:hypothetical protein RI367_001720 [Sorochytrium milnesiophthora]